MSVTTSSTPAPPPQPPRRRGLLFRGLARAGGSIRALAASVRRRPLQSLAAFGLVALIGSAGVFAGFHLLAEYHCRAAQQCLAKYDFPGAQAHIDRALQIRADAPTHLIAARVARKNWNMEGANDHLNECRRILGGDCKEADFERQLMYAQVGDLDSVEDYLWKRVHADDPDSPAILEALAQGYWNNYDVGNANECLTLWLKLEPDNMRAWYLTGQLYERQFLFVQAVEAYRRALALDPKRAEFRTTLAEALLTSGSPHEALTMFQELMQGQPDDPTLRFAEARCNMAIGRNDLAIPVLDQLLEEHPTDVRMLETRGRVARMENDPEKGESCLRTAVGLAPFDLNVNFAFYQCLLAVGKQEEAEKQRERYQSLERDSRRANRLTHELLVEQPHRADWKCELGVIYLRMGLENAGEHWLHSALRDDGTYRPAHRALADYYDKIGKAEKAALHRKEAGAP
jgi:predicted Zn-dependent protease